MTKRWQMRKRYLNDRTIPGKKIVLKRLGFRKLSNSSEMQNDALKHREGLKG